jgi:phage terminase large subunit
MPSRDKKQYSFMKELDNYFKKNDEWYHSQLDYTMLRDDEQIRFLGKAQMREIANTKKYAPLEYREVYLGEEVSGGDSIYVNFDRHRALVQPNHSLYSDIN